MPFGDALPKNTMGRPGLRILPSHGLKSHLSLHERLRRRQPVVLRDHRAAQRTGLAARLLGGRIARLGRHLLAAVRVGLSFDPGG